MGFICLSSHYILFTNITPRRKLITIEADGITHLDEEVAENDEIRQKSLEDIGFTVLRFNDSEVLNDIQNVERVLEAYVEEYELKGK